MAEILLFDSVFHDGVTPVSVLWNTLDTDNFSFLLFNFFDFILISFSFLFLIFFWTMKRHVTLQSHDIMS